MGNNASFNTKYTKELDLKRLKFISDDLKKHKGEKAQVLDVGCGNGNISLYLGSLGYNVKGIDVSEKAIEKAKAQNSFQNVDFEVIDAEVLRDTGARYDGVVCSEVLEHLNEPERLVKVLHKLLKDDGRLYVTVPNGMGPREVLVTKPMQRLEKNKSGFAFRAVTKFKNALGYKGTTIQSAADDLTHIQFFTKPQLEKLSDANGFKIVQFTKANFIDDVFPFSFAANRIKGLQKFDSKIADALPHYFTGGFNMIWEKK